jgi:hypothetical protein
MNLDEALIKEVDDYAGPRGRTAFVREAIREALDQKKRLELFSSAVGSIPDTGHEWDDDPADWVRRQRFEDPGRVG